MKKIIKTIIFVVFVFSLTLLGCNKNPNDVEKVFYYAKIKGARISSEVGLYQLKSGVYAAVQKRNGTAFKKKSDSFSFLADGIKEWPIFGLDLLLRDRHEIEDGEVVFSSRFLYLDIKIEEKNGFTVFINDGEGTLDIVAGFNTEFSARKFIVEFLMAFKRALFHDNPASSGVLSCPNIFRRLK